MLKPRLFIIFDKIGKRPSEPKHPAKAADYGEDDFQVIGWFLLTLLLGFLAGFFICFLFLNSRNGP